MNKALIEITKAKEKGSKKLIIRHLGLTELPEEIGELVHLEELSLMYNNLSHLPKSFQKLTNLKRLHLSFNNFQQIPSVIFQLEKLEHLCIRNNKIDDLPDNIDDLKHIRDIDLDDNEITFLPVTEENIDILDNLSLWNNPLSDPPLEILMQGKEVVKIYLSKRGKILIFTINLPEVILTPFKQYLLTFADYISASKGRNFQLEVRTIDFGILVEVEAEYKDDLNEFEHYFAEYVGFIKQNVEDLNVDYDVNISKTEKEFIKLHLKQEIQHLKMKCDMAEFKVTVLEDTVSTLKQALKESSNNAPQIYLDVKQLQSSQQLQLTKTINQLPNEIERLRDYFEEIRGIEDLNKLNKEIEDITFILGNLASENKEEVKKSSVWKKIKNLINNGTDLIKKSNEGFDGISSMMDKLQQASTKAEEILNYLNML